MHRIKLEIDSKYNDIIFNSLRHEEAPHSKIKCYMEGKKLIFEFEANSISNLRAACNSFIKWIDMVEKIAEEIEEI
ncbi:MAG TPA: hypothetical protein ENG71_00470 [Thermoplasmatales archaeon]|nr:hypothetical protein [Thermoplasmatales archaeon]